jgi:hypothetical protein
LCLLKQLTKDVRSRRWNKLDSSFFKQKLRKERGFKMPPTAREWLSRFGAKSMQIYLKPNPEDPQARYCPDQQPK